MSFQNGSFGFRVLMLSEAWPADWAERMGKQLAATDLKSIGKRAVDRGWTMGDNLLDVDLRPAAATGLVHVAARTAMRKVQPALLAAATAKAIRERLAAEGKAYLKVKVRNEIRMEIEDALLEEAPAALAAVSLLTEVGAKLAFAGATTTAEAEALAVMEMGTKLPGFFYAFPDQLARQQGVEIGHRNGTIFAPESKELFCELRIGCEFLTWLWWAAEAQGGIFQRKGFGAVTAAVEGPLTLAEAAGGGSMRVRLTDGLPTASVEAKAALRAGKILTRARVMLAKNADRVFGFTLDGEDFTFRATKLPAGEAMVAEARLEERYAALREMWALFVDLYLTFLDAWKDAERWQETVVPDIREWVGERAGR